MIWPEKHLFLIFSNLNNKPLKIAERKKSVKAELWDMDCFVLRSECEFETFCRNEGSFILLIDEQILGQTMVPCSFSYKILKN